MKKLLVIPAVIGLLAVPSFVAAQHGADNNPAGVRGEDRRSATAQPATPAVPGVQPAIPSANASRSHETGDDTSTTPPAPSSSSTVTLDQATAIAQAVFPDKTVQKVETETEHGVQIFSVRFTDGSRVDVRASDGAVLRSESENEQEDETTNSQAGQGVQAGRRHDTNDR